MLKEQNLTLLTKCFFISNKEYFDKLPQGEYFKITPLPKQFCAMSGAF
jgi:hypothetical protein